MGKPLTTVASINTGKPQLIIGHHLGNNCSIYKWKDGAGVTREKKRKKVGKNTRI